ncbi:hypothetical protein EDEG_01763 [Edhazardia aedis USNM 41457]|uniref:Uncharacterized protein n=1 Tax=Edhazardia aedis (strain USNM 41457) TaxID=1003232 RepID=J9DN15_EDHAE|nr:hypothetical protein EDEG_01763 [Edhazardia aedis USNM 41457]|eukprot:EJW03945.1 hypothetical protein EDEG_01763 [Edhazardia aedis USNM 41457]
MLLVLVLFHFFHEYKHIYGIFFMTDAHIYDRILLNKSYLSYNLLVLNYIREEAEEKVQLYNESIKLSTKIPANFHKFLQPCVVLIRMLKIPYNSQKNERGTKIVH